VGLTNVCVLVRLASNRVWYGIPRPAERNPITGKRTKRGRPPVHGAKFALKSPPPPEQQAQVTLGGTTAKLSTWTRLHFKGLPRLEGLVVRVEFLKADGTPKYRRPLWLFWSGPGTMALEAIAQLYLARYGIEHFFRFAKQRLGLLCAQTPTLAASETWVWLVAFAYTHLLLVRSEVTPAWRPLGCPTPPADETRIDRRAGVERLGDIFSIRWAHRPPRPEPAEKARGARWGIGQRLAPSAR
jgi:hypothetical protein